MSGRRCYYCGYMVVDPADVERLRAELDCGLDALNRAVTGLVPNLNHPLGRCSGTAHADGTTTWQQVPEEDRCFVCEGLYAAAHALAAVNRSSADDQGPADE